MNPLVSWARYLLSSPSSRPVASPPTGLQARKHADGFDRGGLSSSQSGLWGGPALAKGSKAHQTTAQVGHGRFRDGFESRATQLINLTGLTMAPAMTAIALEAGRALKTAGFSASLDDLPKLG